MKKKVRQGNLAVRAIAIAVTFSMVVSLMTVLGGEASAATSLTGIESIKERGSLSILEIVPQTGTGSIGYYVAGREPTNGWLNELVSPNEAGKIKTKAERDAYAEQLFTNLKAANLMGDKGASDAEYPLIYTGNYTTTDGYYKEYLPWDSRPDNAYSVALTQAEEVKVNGSFDKDASGDYIESNTYKLSAGGDYVQNALYYKYGPGDSEDANSNYYYRLTFTKAVLNNTTISNYFGTPLYTLVNDPLFPGNIYYEYAGTLEDRDSVNHDDFTIDEFTDYYEATVIQVTPTTTWEYLDEVTFTDDELTTTGTEKLIPEGHPLIGSTLYMLAEQGYTAVQIEKGTPVVPGMVYFKLKENAYLYHAVTPSSQPFTEAATAGTGFFAAEDGYKFVGNGKAPTGTQYYKFTANSSQRLWTLVYDTIYVTGGYTNSNWFKRYVLDMDGASNELLNSMRVTVTSRTPGELTPDMFNNYQLVVVSAGFDLTKQGSTIPYSRDISAEVLNALKPTDNPTAQIPRVVDTRILNNSNVSRLASLVDGDTYPSVTANNVYNFAVGTGEDARGALATKQFHTPFSTTTPYQVVADEITYENFLRSTMNQDPLSTEISMATCIRYIINAHLPVNHKTELRVLDIQPYAKRYTDHTTLSVATVQSWLPENSFANDKIKITHMSSAELICNIEDLAEMYDLIYIGASQVGSNLPDGMYYANIGKTQTVTKHVEGLLSSNDSTARYSGNDLTPQKQEELLKFARSGLPIVVADVLTSGLTSTQARTLTASISANNNDNKLTVNHTLNPSASNATVVRQWYKYTTDPANAEPVGTGGTTYTPSNPSVGDHYFCVVTVTVNGVTRSAQSNTMRYTFEGVSNSYYLQRVGSSTNSTYRYWQNGSYFNGSVDEDDLDVGKLTVSYQNLDTSNTRETNNVTYTWKRLNSNGNRDTSWSEVGGNSYTPPEDGRYYYCEIKIGYQRKNTNNGGGPGGMPSMPGMPGMPGGGNNSQWGQEQFETITSPAYKAVKRTGSSTSQNYYTQTSAGISATFESTASGTATLDPTKVDGHSLMYEALNSVWSRPNVVVQSTVQRVSGSNPTQALIDNQHILLQYLNLSRPSINLTSAPPAYEADFSFNNNGTVTFPSPADDNCNGTLNFSFTIQNPTDPTPLQTKYTCNLYIDQNGDGRHNAEEGKNNERIGGLLLYDSATGTPVANGELVAGTPYTLSRTIGQQFTGMVAWKLEVVKEGDETARGTQKGYTYNQPATRTPINVLQIMPILWNDRHSNNRPEPEGVNLKNDDVFKKLYKALYDEGMYDISVTTVNVADLNNKAVDTDNNPDTPAQTFSSVKDLYDNYLSQFNMLIIGFDNCYHDLNTDTARAVEQYIGSGRAVLFTHDTTSFFNEAEEDATVLYRYWGYTFNQFIRDKVGLDRYGVTNPTYGKVDDGAGSITRGVVANGNNGRIDIGGSTEENLKNAGYTVAYLPYTESATKKSAGATHGFTDYNIYRYTNANNSETSTSQVSQVNQGMVTQFPFTMDEILTVDSTHNQYYQLNMNADDIVVWYCLYGTSGNLAKHYNDGTNGYYIYNRGNITYSGAGHLRSLGDEEKALFVNTMVAAYRAARTAPTVQFVTANGYDTSTQLVTAEEGTSLNMNQPIYFKLTDTNLTANKSLSVELYYEVAAGTANSVTMASAGLGDNTEKYVLKTSLGDNIYRADTGVKVSDPNNLSSGVIYRTLLPQAVLDKFPPDASDLTIYLKVITTFGNDPNNTLSGKDDLKLQKLGLLRLE